MRGFDGADRCGTSTRSLQRDRKFPSNPCRKISVSFGKRLGLSFGFPFFVCRIRLQNRCRKLLKVPKGFRAFCVFIFFHLDRQHRPRWKTKTPERIKARLPLMCLQSPPRSRRAKERGRANTASQQTKRNRKHGLWRNFKELSRTRQVELCFLGLVAMGGIGYLIAYICISVSQSHQARWNYKAEHRARLIFSRPPELWGLLSAKLRDRKCISTLDKCTSGSKI